MKNRVCRIRPGQDFLQAALQTAGLEVYFTGHSDSNRNSGPGESLGCVSVSPRIVAAGVTWHALDVIGISKKAKQESTAGAGAKPGETAVLSSHPQPVVTNPDALTVGKRVLVVENEPVVLEILRMLLQLDGHAVTEARSGREACLQYAPGDFDLVIIEQDMPEMPGDELARTIKCLVPSQPMLMLTTYAEKVCSDENPVNAVLERPFTVGALRGMVAFLCTHRPPAPASVGSPRTA